MSPAAGRLRRAAFSAALDEHAGRTLPSGASTAVVLLDVDGLAALNAERGVALGDRVLAGLETRLGALVRGDDTLQRLDGGTFGLVLPGARRLDGLLVAERMRATVARQAVEGCRLTLSAGVAAVPDDGRCGPEVVDRARHALAWAKAHGRNLCALARDAASGADAPDEGEVLVHLHAVVASIDAQHTHTRDHSENVASYAVAIGQALGLEEAHVMRVRRAAYLHDIGKIAVDDAILSKPGRLTPAEVAQIEVHPAIGGRMLHRAGLVDEAVWVRHHHERLDGRGYPDGLLGDAIPFESRLIFVVDAFEAMTSDRPYRRGMPVDAALAELRRCAGTQFDPDVVAAFSDLLADGSLVVQALRGGSPATVR